jgi:hypothetical protein
MEGMPVIGFKQCSNIRPLVIMSKKILGCEKACESNPLDFEPMKIVQGPSLDYRHDATGSGFRADHFQSERKDSHGRCEAQKIRSPFTAAATATSGLKPLSPVLVLKI